MQLLPLLVIVAGVVIALAMRNTRKVDQAWNRAAARLGLRFSPSSLFRSRSLAGRRGGYTVGVGTVSRGSGNTSKRFTRYRVGYPTLGLGLRIQRQGPLAGVAKAFGAQDIEVRNDSFDARALVKGGDPDRVRAFLTPVRAARIELTLGRYSHCSLTDSSITAERRGTESDAGKLVATIRDLCEVADVLAGTTTEEEPLEPFPEWEPPAEAPDVPAEIPPDDGALETATPGPEETEPTPQVDEPPPLEDPAEICDELFRAGRMSTEISGDFDGRLAGRRVRWSGKLARIERFSSDLVFQGGPGAKARIELHEVADDSWGAKLVHAVVQLPRDVGDALAGQRGETISFEGRLVRCDPFMRLLFVAEGSLTDR